MIRWGIVLLVLLSVIGLCGCVDRARLNTGCAWSGDPAVPLDLRTSAHQRHLTHDAQLAEELAVRHGDSFRSRQGLGEARRKRAECLQNLTATITTIHGVTRQQVAEAAVRRNPLVDAVAVLLPVGLVFAWVANGAARGLYRRIPPDQTPWAIAATVLASAMIAAAGVMAGELWASLVEMIRVSDTHMSFRASRIPWTQQRVYLFAAGLMIFWVVAARRFRAVSRTSS